MDIYPVALRCGINPDEFWKYSIIEITDLVEAYQETEKWKLKNDISSQFMLAKQIGNYIAYILNPKEVEMPKEAYEIYPELFAEEAIQMHDVKQKQELEVYKAQMTDYALKHNNLSNKMGKGLPEG